MDSPEHTIHNEYVEPDHSELERALFEPSNAETGPGVLVLHGGAGEPSLRKAALLAERGYTAFALHYFSGDGLPDNASELPLEYVRDAATWLCDRESTAGDRVWLIGSSLGGQLALLAESEFDVSGPVVSINGSGVVSEGFTGDNYPTGTSTWTLDGEPVPYLNSELWYGGPDGAGEDEVEAASIQVEEIDGRVLLVAGGDDRVWPSAELHGVAADRLDEHGHPDYEHLVYEDTGHYILERYTPAVGLIREGGTYAGAAEASHDHWGAVLDTFSSLRDR